MFRTRNFADKATLNAVTTLSADEMSLISGGNPSDFMKGVAVGIAIGMMLLI
jgi:hypothetical protein